uniref:Uncharacterized protein n=1 Tax=Octopus bimaculoides TaxID=37653 RepID=A0A0L8FRM8_OCTBM
MFSFQGCTFIPRGQTCHLTFVDCHVHQQIARPNTIGGGHPFGEPYFSHGQLYVACSCVGSRNTLFAYAPQGRTRNVVYSEVL